MGKILSETNWLKLQEFVKNKWRKTPYQLIFLDVIKKNYKTLTKNFDYAKIYYAIKANSAHEILSSLDKLGSNFDVASIYELEEMKELNISPERISYGNTIKKSEDIKTFYDYGVRLFTSDSKVDLDKISKNAPNSNVVIRILVNQFAKGADWPLSKKFGCDIPLAIELINYAKEIGLNPIGISFHVGSQQHNITAWYSVLKEVKNIFEIVKERYGIELNTINMGGGMPAYYGTPIESIETYCKLIKSYLSELFGEKIPNIILQPGRSLVGNSGVLVTQVISKTQKYLGDNSKWVYVDCGKFGGLMETLDEAIKYPILTDYQSTQPTEHVILAGPTCDSADTLYEKNLVRLPQNIKEGDRIYICTTGAYTYSYSAIGFNGFPPLNYFIIN